MTINLYQRNVGTFDRWMRVVVGIALVILGVWTAENGSGDHAGLYLALGGIAVLMSGITGRCPLYVPFGICTLRRPS